MTIKNQYDAFLDAESEAEREALVEKLTLAERMELVRFARSQETSGYDVLVIDPPWPMAKIKRDVRPNQVALDYPTMSIAEITAAVAASLELQVPDQDEPSSGWDTYGNEFTITDEPPYTTRWRSLRGTAKEKLAAFDSELARQLEQRKITLPAAKSILLQRDVDAAVRRQVAELDKATAPYLGLVLRGAAGNVSLTHVVGCLMLKCTCGALRERLSYFAHDNTYRVVCPKCGTAFAFEDRKRNGFVLSDAGVPADLAALLTHQCDVPIRELARENLLDH